MSWAEPTVIPSRITISVVIPVFDAASTLGQCAASLHAQRFPRESVELIFVDDGSTDGCLESLTLTRGTRVIRTGNQGAYAARNRGAAAASGGIIAFIDPDCIADPGWLDGIARAFEDAACQVALGVRRPCPDRGMNRMLGDYEVTKDRWVIESGQPLKYYGYTNTMAVRRSAWERFGPFDERPRGADTIFVRRAVDSAGCESVRFVPEMLVSHLEVDGPWMYMKKVYTYGASSRRYGRVIRFEPLSTADRMRVYWRTIRGCRYGPVRAITLALLLAMGSAVWMAGRLSAR
jgi:glycosyltransferase involved in cell wall biosynthesis